MSQTDPSYTGIRAMSENTAQGWQPIETAPKDGTIILVGGHGKNGFFVTDAKYSDGVWNLFDPRDDEYTVEFDEPPYWQPLPSPPEPLSTTLPTVREE